MENLKQAYEKAVNNYLKAFCEKHEYDYEEAAASWVGNNVGECVFIADYYVDFATIKTDIDNNAPIGEFVAWYDYTLRIGMIDCCVPKSDITIPNFEHWLMGCPRWTEEQFIKAENAQRKVDEAKESLFQIINEQLNG